MLLAISFSYQKSQWGIISPQLEWLLPKGQKPKKQKTNASQDSEKGILGITVD
jgi:hypothetical protein